MPSIEQMVSKCTTKNVLFINIYIHVIRILNIMDIYYNCISVEPLGEFIYRHGQLDIKEF